MGRLFFARFAPCHKPILKINTLCLFFRSRSDERCGAKSAPLINPKYMFGKQNTDRYLDHLEEEIEQLRESLQNLQNRMDAQAEAFAEERALFAEERKELLNRLVGLPPQAGPQEQAEETGDPIPYKSRISQKMDELQKRQRDEYEKYLDSQAKRDKGLDEFREVVRAEAAADASGVEGGAL